MSTSSKFLPFITEKSSELSIFKAIVQRTKGSTKSAISDLFSIVLTLGIEEVRNRMDSFSLELTSSAKVKELISQHPQYHVPKNEQLFWSCVLGIYNKENTQCSNYTLKEQEIIFSVIAITKPERLNESGFVDVNYEVCKLFSKESFDVDTHNIKDISISEHSERVGFTCWEELKAFIAVNINSDSEIEIMPVKIDVTREEISLADYERNHCISPCNRN